MSSGEDSRERDASAALALVRGFEAISPAAVRLARAVSLAVRVEPELLRRARLALVPGADAGTEADLWFSPLVVGANPLVLVSAGPMWRDCCGNNSRRTRPHSSGLGVSSRRNAYQKDFAARRLVGGAGHVPRAPRPRGRRERGPGPAPRGSRDTAREGPPELSALGRERSRAAPRRGLCARGGMGA